MASEGEVQFSEILDIRSPNEDKKPKTMKACVLLVLSILNIPELMAVVIVFQPNNKYLIMLNTEDFIQKKKNANYTSSCSCIEYNALDDPDCSVIPGLCLLLFSSIAIGLPR